MTHAVNMISQRSDRDTGALILGSSLALAAWWPMLLLIGRSTRVLRLAVSRNDVVMPYGRLLALIVPGIILAFRWYVAVQAAAIEHEGWLPAIRRSRTLTAGVYGHLFAFGILIGIIAGVPQLIGRAAVTGHEKLACDEHDERLMSTHASRGLPEPGSRAKNRCRHQEQPRH